MINAVKQSRRIRDAASLILVRDIDSDPRVLLGKRASSNRFMPGMYVFPGGALQPEDFHAAVASNLDPHYSGRMGVRGNRSKATALANTAIRETLEETGLLLGHPGDVGDLTDQGWRAIRETGLRPCLQSMTYLGRAVTPAFMPIRFNARFFIATATGFHGVQTDSDELGDLQWIRPCQWPSFPLVDITAYILQNFDEIRRRSTRRQSFVFRYNKNRPVIRWQGEKQHRWPAPVQP